MDRLLQWIQREESQSRRDRNGGLFRLCLLTEQPSQRFERQVAQALSRRGQPLLEWRFGHAEAFQQLPLIELGRFPQRLRWRLADEPLEREDVDVEGTRVQSHRVLVEAQAR